MPDSNRTRSYRLSGPVLTLGGLTPFRTPRFDDSYAGPERAFDRDAYHNARGHQHGPRATQTAEPGAQAREALSGAERTKSNQAAPGSR